VKCVNYLSNTESCGDKSFTASNSVASVSIPEFSSLSVDNFEFAAPSYNRNIINNQPSEN
jgi:hypothetical protein